MKILLFLVVLYLIGVCYSQNTTPYILADLFYKDKFCHDDSSYSSSSPINCPTSNQYGGYITREGTCMYIHGMSYFTTSFNTSTDGSIIQYSYGAGDYFCDETPISQEKHENGVCQKGCFKDGLEYEVGFSSSNDLQIPSNTILTIQSKSKSCSTDWKETWDVIEYSYLNVCTMDLTGERSVKYDCNEDGALIAYSYGGTVCASNPAIITQPLDTNCQSYQVCNKQQ